MMRKRLRLVVTALVALIPMPALAQPEEAPPTEQDQAGGETPEQPAPGSRLTKAPRLVRFVEAEYPPEAAEQGLSADVTLTIDVDADGRVTNVAVAAPAGNGFDEAAMAAARQFEFEPAEAGGVRVPVRITYVYHFVMREAAPDEIPEEQAPVNFRGTLLERGTRVPIPAASVEIPDLGLSEITDGEGRFEMRGVPPGRWVVRILLPEHEPLEAEEEFTEGRLTESTYHVEALEYSRYEIVVRGERIRREATQRTLEMQEVSRIPGTSGDTVRVVENLPGVARSSFGSGALVVWGSSSQENNILLDGLTMPRLYHFGGFRSVVNPEIVSSIEFVPGGFGARYGYATGGIVDVRTRNRRPDDLRGVLAVDLIDTSLFVQSPVGDDWDVMVAGRRSYLDATLPAIIPEDALRFVRAPVYYDYQARVGRRLGGGGQAWVMAYGSDDRAEFVGESPDPDQAFAFELHDYFHRLTLNVVQPLGRRTGLSVSGGGGFDSTGVAVSAGGMSFDGRFDNYFVPLRAEIEHEASPQLTLRIGMDDIYVHGTVDVTSPAPVQEGDPAAQSGGGEELDDVASFDAYLVTPYVEADFEVGDDLLHTIPGLRFGVWRFSAYEDSPDEVARTDLIVEPRLTQRLRIVDPWTVFWAFGLYQNVPDSSVFSRSYGDPDIEIPRATHYVLGLRHQTTATLSIETEAFYKHMTRLIVPNPERGTSVETTDEPRLLNEGVGRAYGAELLVRLHRTHGLFGWIAYTLMRSERRDHPEDPWRLFDVDQTHILTLVASYDLGAHWELGTRFRLASGNPYTPVVGSYFDARDDRYVPLFGATNSRRIPLFHQLDVRIEKTFVFDAWMLAAYLELQNAYNRANPEGIFYGYDYSEHDFVTGLPMFPVLGVRGEL